MRLLMLDNYDSFTFNLAHYLLELGADVQVVRADEISARDALASGADGFVISPGPGRPAQAGESMALVRACFDSGKPLLGVCLGHQAIAAEFGATIIGADQVMHGKTSPILHDGDGIFANLPSPIAATRYHSLVVDRASLPEELRVTATANDGSVQSLSHRGRPIHGVQFHPESIASEHGHALLRNFLAIVEETVRAEAGLG
ncbi:MAG: aminodeoxychorismate/anthranilate synthase component II [Sphingomicrobium sp.]